MHACTREEEAIVAEPDSLLHLTRVEGVPRGHPCYGARGYDRRLVASEVLRSNTNHLCF